MGCCSSHVLTSVADDADEVVGVLGLHLPDVAGDDTDLQHRAGGAGDGLGEVVILHAAAGEVLADDGLDVAVGQEGLLAVEGNHLGRDLDDVVAIEGLDQIDSASQLDDLLDRAGAHQLRNVAAVAQAAQELRVGLAEHGSHAVAEIPAADVGHAQIAGGEVGLDVAGAGELGVGELVDDDGLGIGHSCYLQYVDEMCVCPTEFYEGFFVAKIKKIK